MEMPAPMLRPRPDGVWGQEAGSRPGPVTDLLRVLRVTPSPVGLSFPIGRSRKALCSISQLRPSAIFVTCSLKATLWTHNPHFTDKEDEALKGYVSRSYRVTWMGDISTAATGEFRQLREARRPGPDRSGPLAPSVTPLHALWGHRQLEKHQLWGSFWWPRRGNNSILLQKEKQVLELGIQGNLFSPP